MAHASQVLFFFDTFPPGAVLRILCILLLGKTDELFIQLHFNDGHTEERKDAIRFTMKDGTEILA